MSQQTLVSACLGDMVVSISEFVGDLTVEVSKNKIIHALEKLKSDPSLQFDFLSDVVGIDNLGLHAKKAKAPKKDEPQQEAAPDAGATLPRFEVVYLLLSLSSNKRLRVRVAVPEDDCVVESVTGLWRAANWPEREIYDMFGIRFKGHPDLRRLLMWDEFKDHPLRKDYPLEGKNEERILNYLD